MNTFIRVKDPYIQMILFYTSYIEKKLYDYVLLLFSLFQFVLYAYMIFLHRKSKKILSVV